MKKSPNLPELPLGVILLLFLFGNVVVANSNSGTKLLAVPISTVHNYHSSPTWWYTYNLLLYPVNTCTDTSPPEHVKSRDDLPPGTLVYEPSNPGVYFTPDQAFTTSFIPDSPPEVSLDPTASLPSGWDTEGKDEAISETPGGGSKPRILSRLIRSPNITAPLNGHLSIGKDPDDKFLLGLRGRKDPPSKITEVLQDQFELTLLLFKELGRMEGEQNGSAGDLRMAMQLDSYTWEEPDTSELTVLDSVFNFGLPATRVRFGNPTGSLLRKWNDLEAEDESDAPPGADEDSFLQELDDIRSEAIKKGDQFSYPFKQYQFFFRPPGECPNDIDPGQEVDTIKPQSVSAGRKARGGGENNEGGGGRGERPDGKGKKKKENNKK